MQNTTEQEYGIGIEMEGFIVNSCRGQEKIAGQPAAEWTKNQFAKRFPQMAEHLSLEEASVMLEVKSNVFQHHQPAIIQIQEVRGLVNEILAPHGCKLIFEPVLKTPFEFIPASSDPNSRAHQLIKEWSHTPEGLQMLYSTAIASYQINDSRPFRQAVSEEEKMEIARRLHNLYSVNFDEVVGQNVPKRDHEGLTRMDRLFHLLSGVKSEQFAKSGFENPLHALIPPYFADVESMKRWMTAHTKEAATFEQAQCKNEHAVTVKAKRDPYWALETRTFDAVDSFPEMDRIASYNEQFMQPFLADHLGH